MGAAILCSNGRHGCCHPVVYNLWTTTPARKPASAMKTQIENPQPSEKKQSDLLSSAERTMPGACLGMLWLPPELRMVMVRGQGSKLYDSEGEEYLDYMLGSGPMILGHAHPEVVKAVEQQVKLGSTFFALTEPAIRLAERIVDAVPCGDAIRFQTTGSEATLSAVRLARAFTGREKILKFEGGWHGGHDLGQLSGAPAVPPPYPTAEPDCDGIPQSACQDTLVAPFNDLSITSEIVEAHAGEIAAVIAEPLQRAVKPELGFLEGLRELTNRFEIPLIFDEIVSGFRIAWGGAQERYGVVPDMACYGKAVSGGYPLSAIVGISDLMAAADPRRKADGSYCFLSGTLTGNPISAAAGLATLNVLDRPGVYDRFHQVGATLREGISEVGRQLSEPVQVIGDGPVIQLFFTEHPIKNYRDGLKADKQKAVRFGHEMIRRKVYLSPGGKMYLSLAHSDDDIDATLQRVKAAMQAVR